ncbi:5'-AMP-activated protein kinase beta subunit, interation domain-containing protein [Rhodocollybia butyracea]|uniref:5'-AMP-activated protein kinase beta subunit, interation domain-containing protein n=1 Tax=Rhodocollybia butyracea TaxID=206335 RepID=A0A9P5Q8Q9_9AGAR|nr:5'-AMP-activated protein kinase beta subunit, interation domain-containing protein [Rhodocollybia butyracea]
MGNSASSSSSKSPTGKVRRLPADTQSAPIKRRGTSLDLPDLINHPLASEPRTIPQRQEKKEVRYAQQTSTLEQNVKRVQHEAQLHYVPSVPRVVAFESISPPPELTSESPNQSESEPDSDLSSAPIIIRSSIPMLLAGPDGDENEESPEPAAGNIDKKIYWHEGGTSVFLVHAAENGNVKTMMDKEEADSIFSTTISLPPGTHHFRFFVDGQWRVDSNLPQAVDDLGSLANYITVELSANNSPTVASPVIVSPQRPLDRDLFPLGRLSLGRSFWSASTDNSDYDQDLEDVGPHTLQWTTEIPLELIEAFTEEENYLALAALQLEMQQMRLRSGVGPVVQTGFTPSPKHPAIPYLPRYLDKLILNTSLSQTVGRSSDRRKRGGKDKDPRDADVYSAIVSRPLPVTTASGTDITRSFGLRAADPERMVPVIEDDTTSASAAANALAFASIADDASVLPVPSHAVLHHLSTTAINDGVLAIASTVRYRKKYLTTVYYTSA